VVVILVIEAAELLLFAGQLELWSFSALMLLDNRKGIQFVKSAATAVIKCLLLETHLIWNCSRKMGNLRKMSECI